jgi:hypothetical protein
VGPPCSTSARPFVSISNRNASGLKPILPEADALNPARCIAGREGIYQKEPEILTAAVLQKSNPDRW